MASEKQINANRLNAQKSTGPKTPQGKAISSCNAAKTGRQEKAMAALAAAEYRTMAADYQAEFDPQTPQERFYLRVLVQSLWQTRQLWRVETALWSENLAQGASTAADPEAMYRVSIRASKEFDRVSRLIHSADRNFHWSLTQLLNARDRKRKAAARQKSATAPLKTNSGLVLISR